ncbi:SMP-30/gluconolactonase/LRE family protein [uncultured Roseobacter sp.]|uniref:SMP-30/gluconolactonase/LRE family protein n=1 Tax=uncultured Roseobacter sp. TaxID=114847 RepID=UPI002618D075|nr:SMP-30/gluconolactonase/LRE family protein [uncultured Roseobacter sp.]
MTTDLSISFLGKRLSRPESVLSTKTGEVFCSHNGHGVMRICPDGRQFLLQEPSSFGGMPVVPNGIALRPDGSFLIANISDAGGVLEMDADGLRPHAVSTGGSTLPPVNFVYVDQLGKTWITVSSKLRPRSRAYRRDVKNGYVGLINADNSFSVVLQGLHYTNEVRPDYEGGWLYIAETFGQKISRVRLDEKGVHGEPELFVQFGPGTFVDGIELDGADGLYAACIVSSELYHIDPEAKPTLIVGERDDAWVECVEAALDNHTMDRAHFDSSPAEVLQNISSLAFVGEKRDRIVCGNLLGDSLPVFDAPISGPKPPYWNVEVPIWGAQVS